ncbi:MAG: Rne/Rng family ribonuclease [Desulfovibrio sp.]|jgi:ribonuclease E|nr:Rne/Rng family ribonuclease [Desulfovibrio sp.]
MAYVTDNDTVEETSPAPAHTERKDSGRTRAAAAKKNRGTKKNTAPAASESAADQADATGQADATDKASAADQADATGQASAAELTNAADAPSSFAGDAAQNSLPADLSPGEEAAPAQDAPLSSRKRPATGKGAVRGTGAKSASRTKKSAASGADTTSLSAAVDQPPTAEASLDDTPEQPEASLAAASASRAKGRPAGRARRATAKTAALPDDTEVSVATPGAAASGATPADPAAAGTSPIDSSAAGTTSADPAVAEQFPETGVAALPHSDAGPVDAHLSVDSAVDAALFVGGPVDAALPADGPLDAFAATYEPYPADDIESPAPEEDASAAPAGKDAPGTAVDPADDDKDDDGVTAAETVDEDNEDGIETTAETVDEDNPDGAETTAETTGEGGRKRRRSRRGGRGRRKNNRAAGAGNGTEAGSAEAAQNEEAAVPATAPSPEAPTEAQAGTKTDAEQAEQPYDDTDAPQTAGAKGKAHRKMFVSVLPGEQVEVVITEDGQVQEYYVEMLHQAKTKGNIYKGVVHNIDPNLQAAFVGYGAGRNGFLQIDEIHPEYYVSPHDGSRGRKYPLIQKILKPGQEVLVQVVKEPAGSKGAFLTTYLSIPGRFLVLTPGREQVGVSRKVEDDGERARLRELLEGLTPGPGLGVIVRTVSMGAGKTNLQRDLQFLKRTWKEVRARGTSETAPCMIYQEMDLTARAVRDYLNESIDEVRIDDEETAAAVTEVAEALFPRRKNLVRVYKDPGMSLFERFNIQRQLDQIHSREVTLPSGGRLVIDATEALTAIDINSGRSGGKNNFEDLAYRTNMEAAAMIPLQLRLRDIGGQIVADFIEMRDRSHWREVEKTLRNGMKADRARYDVGKVSAFGLLEMVRQRLGSSAISVSTEPCPFCNGAGVRRNMEWRCQHALRDIRNLMRNAQSKNAGTAEYHAEPELALHLLNHKRKLLTDLEQTYGVSLTVRFRASEPGG